MSKTLYTRLALRLKRESSLVVALHWFVAKRQSEAKKGAKGDENASTIVEGGGKRGDIDKRVSQIRAQIEQTDSEYDKEKFQERLAKLAGGVAIVRHVVC